MSGEWGVWSDAAGGFIGGPYYTEAEASGDLLAFILDGEDDAEVIAWVEYDDDDVDPDDE